MTGLATATLDAAGAHQPRVEGVAELGHHDQIVQRHRAALRLRPAQQLELGRFAFAGPDDARHLPQPLIAFGSGAALRQHAHLVALAHRALRQLHGFRPVALEVQAERQARRQGAEFALQIGAQRGILVLGLRDQLSQSRHRVRSSSA